MSDTGGPPPGWYDDPDRPGGLRYWDGSRWTDDRRRADGTSESMSDGSFATAPPSTWLWQSIVSLLFFWPLGIVAVIHAAQAQSAVSSGNYSEAREKANRAKLFALIAIGLGVLFVVVAILLILSFGGLTELQELQELSEL